MDRSIILGEVQCETARFYGGDDPGVIIYHQGRVVGICIGNRYSVSGQPRQT
jgi:hypothetical protein